MSKWWLIAGERSSMVASFNHGADIPGDKKLSLLSQFVPVGPSTALAALPAASRISWVISSDGRSARGGWIFSSMVLAPMRLAMKRSRSGLMVRSSVETA